MGRFLPLAWLACLVNPSAILLAQNLVITNARIIDGNGGVIPRGSMVVRDGRIASVSQSATAAGAGHTINAGGLTVMPGFIDDHRHIIAGSFPPQNPDQWMKDQSAMRMQEFLEAGFTTVQSCGDPVEQIVELQRRLNTGQIKGPRLFTASFVQLSQPSAGAGRATGGLPVDPARNDSAKLHRPARAAKPIPDEEARAQVRRLKLAGIDDVKAVLTVSPDGPETRTLSVIVDEAKKAGMPVITHAVSVEDMLAAVSAGTTMLAHTPHIGQLNQTGARKVAESKIPMMSTLGVFVPTFAEDNERIRARTSLDNVPRFRDLDPFPWDTLPSAGQGAVNARLLWEAGVVYGYGTDTTFLPKDSLVQELKALRLMFSRKDIVQIMTRNAAAVIGHSKEIGTLEPGKQADIVLLGGDPLANIDNVVNVRMVIKGGNIVVDRRTPAASR